MPHNWTQFEQRALLGLLCRNIHISGLSENPEGPDGAPAKRRLRQADPRAAAVSRQHAYVDVATALNRAINNGDYKADIPIDEVSKMIDRLLGKKKAAKLFMERQRVGRITKTMRKVWERGIGFDGTLKEWEGGRKQEEARREERRRMGVVLMSVESDARNTTEAVDAWGQEVTVATNSQTVYTGGWDTVDTVAALVVSDSGWATDAEGDAMYKSSRATTGISGQTLLVSEDIWGRADAATSLLSNPEWGTSGVTGAIAIKPTNKTTSFVPADDWGAEAATEVVGNPSWPTAPISTADYWGGIGNETAVVENSEWGGGVPTTSTAAPQAVISAMDATPDTSLATEWGVPSVTVTPVHNNSSPGLSVDIQCPPASTSTFSWDKEFSWASSTASAAVLTPGDSNSPQDSHPPPPYAIFTTSKNGLSETPSTGLSTAVGADVSMISVTAGIERASTFSSSKDLSTPMALEGINPQRLAMLTTGVEIDMDMADGDGNDEDGELGESKRGGEGAKGWVAGTNFMGAKGSNAMPLSFNRLEASRGAAGRGLHDSGEAMDILREGD